MAGCDISTWRCLAYCSWDVFIFLFKENFHGSLCHQGPSGAPGNVIPSEEQRGKFAEDQMQKLRERRGLGVTDENGAGSSPDLRAMNNGGSTHSLGCVAVGGVRGDGDPPNLAEDISLGRSRARHSPPGRVSTNEKQSSEKEDGVKGWESRSSCSCRDRVSLPGGLCVMGAQTWENTVPCSPGGGQVSLGT